MPLKQKAILGKIEPESVASGQQRRRILSGREPFTGHGVRLQAS
jgi:hypothetical protein